MLSDVALAALRCGGTLHLVQLPATLLLLRHVRARRVDDAVPDLIRLVLSVLAGGIVLLVFGGFVLCWTMPTPILNEPFGAMFAAFWAAFWLYRLLVQCFVYGPRTDARYRWVHRGLVAVFTLKATCFTTAALLAGSAVVAW